MGFTKQFQQMTDKTRIWTSIIFFTALFLTLFSALVLKNGLLVFIFLIIQFSAFVWYCASYIPFARDCIKGCISKLIG